ncbi:unnamed protein product [Hermetia illucens]|uniref:Neuropeptide-like 4 n=1 Tax=Hermetia illucens TaxID=343691 RepID=A0A7R8YQR4_HERIL|nr:uncharacterized protein LOC119649282 [Hermetia illucens]CAD7081661.1 unnamed protein product [Hermetia illucens]
MFKYVVVVLFALLAVSLAAPAPAPAPKPQFLAAAPYAYPGYAAYTAPYVVSPYSLGYSGLAYGYAYPYTFF